MTTQVKCNRCDRMILESTAKANNGFCGVCVKGEDRRVLEETVEGWIRNPKTLPGTNGIPEPSDCAGDSAAQLRAARTPEGKMQSVCHAFFEQGHTKWSELGAKALSEKGSTSQRIDVLRQVTNGGLLQYLGNQTAFANWAAAGFDQIGIPEYACYEESWISVPERCHSRRRR